MDKTRSWAGGAAAVLLVLALLAVLLLHFIDNARTASFGPLEDDLLRNIVVNPQSKNDGAFDNPLETARVDTPPQAASTGTDMESDDGGRVSADSLSRLAKSMSREALLREFRPGTNPLENAYRGILGRGMKVKESLFWSAGSADTGLTALHIGQLAMSRGDIDEARDYFRAALEANMRSGDLSLRLAICGQLAWVEDDPEVAATLLAASCTASRPIDEGFMAFRIQDALALSILTGSHELAEHYYARWDELEPGAKPIINPLIERGASEQIQSWLEERHPDFYETATRWDPAQKHEESGAKKVG